MLGGIIVILITWLLAFFVLGKLKERHPKLDVPLLKSLFFYHLALSFVYYIYAVFNPSDSKGYYGVTSLADDWFSLYGTSTTFIKFITFPFIHYMGFSYEAMMALFAFLGYLGFVYMYLFFAENVKFKHTILGFDFIKVVFFLPNLHFWSGSLGKGSMIFLGFALFFFGITRVRQRWVAAFIGAVIIYHVRPHVMLIVLVSSALSFVFSSQGISTAVRVGFLAVSTVAFFFIYQDVLTLVGIDEDQFITQGLDLSHRASELSKATSGVDISSYSLPFQIFTFLYRPLFVDATGFLGIIVSFENVLYLLITIQFLNLSAIRFIIQGNFLVKSAFLSFILVAIALSQISGNLGLAIRQKSQVMMLFLFVVIAFLDERKWKVYRSAQRKRVAKRATDPPVDTIPRQEDTGTSSNAIQN